MIIGFSYVGSAQNEFLNKTNSFAPVGTPMLRQM